MNVGFMQSVPVGTVVSLERHGYTVYARGVVSEPRTSDEYDRVEDSWRRSPGNVGGVWIDWEHPEGPTRLFELPRNLTIVKPVTAGAQP